MPDNISPRHQKLIEYLDAHVIPEREKLLKEYQNGTFWGDFSAIKSCFNVIDSKDLAFFGKYKEDAGIFGNIGACINLDYKTDERLANVMAASIESAKKYSGPQAKYAVYHHMADELITQNGSYHEGIKRSLDLLNFLKKQYETSPEEKKPQILKQYTQINEIFSKEYLSRTSDEESNSKYDDIKNFKTGEFICREYNAESCIAMHFAGQETYYVNGTVNSGAKNLPFGHSFMAAKDNSFIYDPTFQSEGEKFSFFPVLNREADISKGETLIAVRPDGSIACYGSGQLGGNEKEIDQAFRNGKITRGEILEKIREHDSKLLEEARTKYAAEIKYYKQNFDKLAEENKASKKPSEKDLSLSSEDGKKQASVELGDKLNELVKAQLDGSSSATTLPVIRGSDSVALS